MKPEKTVENVADESSFPYADWVESTLEQSLRARYEETIHRWQESFRDMCATHRAILELQKRQIEAGKAVSLIPPLLSWDSPPPYKQTADKSSTPEQSQ